jgi:hypothetical protein
MGLTLISTHTASSDATLDITSGIDSTYNEYQFYFVNIHPSEDWPQFHFQVNAVGASGFNENITSAAFYAFHEESGSAFGEYTFGYRTNAGQANADQAYQALVGYNVGYDNDQSASGILTLYDPSSTTYVKHFTSEGSVAVYNEIAANLFTAGYINTTSAIDEISFKFNSGNIDAGTIYMYGVS